MTEVLGFLERVYREGQHWHGVATRLTAYLEEAKVAFSQVETQAAEFKAAVARESQTPVGKAVLAAIAEAERRHAQVLTSAEQDYE